MIPSIKYHLVDSLVDSHTIERAQNQGQVPTAAIICPESLLEPNCLNHFVVLCIFVLYTKALALSNHNMAMFLENLTYSFKTNVTFYL